MDPVEYYNSVWSWGQASGGRLGDNSTVNKSSPVSVVGDYTDWCQVSSGTYITFGLRLNGTAWTWGCNNSGQLGDGTTVFKSSPVSVVGGFTDWCQIKAGSNHGVGIRTNGTAWAWGYNGQGSLGTNNTTTTSSPVSTVGGFTDWCQITAGNKTSFGIRTNGVLYAWGYNNSGRLGDNTVNNKSSPVSVVGGFTDWCFIQNCNNTLGVRTNGTLWAWGNNNNGQLGDNTCTDRSSPVSVVGGFTDWCQIRAGGTFSLALRTNGTAWAWGCGTQGRLGDNTITNKSSPVSVVGGYTDWWDISAGVDFSLAIRKSCGF
jgi:alpha-tubulin suppressor-like RCC1 family protein